MSAYVSEGLFDLQVNGYAGVDFNDAALTADALDHALEAMLKNGVTMCLPTLITGEAEALQQRLAALDAAVAASRLGPEMVPGYHLEGPFLNAGEGYHGCHPSEAMRDPDAALVDYVEGGIERPILLVTFAPERDGAVRFASEMKRRGKTLAMAHSAAGYAAVRAAADAGLTLSTHLGNGLPQVMPKLENALLAQLAEPRLTACLIADGHHMSPEALGALVRIKGTDRCILVTDAVVAAAAPPGHYTFAGMQVEHTPEGAVTQPGRANLAGSALTLDRAVQNVVAWGIADAPTALAMASTHPRAAMAAAFAHHEIAMPPRHVVWSADLVPQVQPS